MDGLGYKVDSRLHKFSLVVGGQVQDRETPITALHHPLSTAINNNLVLAVMQYIHVMKVIMN